MAKKKAVNDWVLGVGIDTKAVESGILKIEKMMKKLNNSLVITPKIIMPTMPKVTVPQAAMKAAGGATVKKASVSSGIGGNAFGPDEKIKDWEAAVKRLGNSIRDFGTSANNTYSRLTTKSDESAKAFADVKANSDKLFTALSSAKNPTDLTNIRTELMSVKRAFVEIIRAEKDTNVKAIGKENLSVEVDDFKKRIQSFEKSIKGKFKEGSIEAKMLDQRIDDIRESLVNIDSRQSLRRVQSDLRDAARESVMLERNLRALEKHRSLLELAGNSWRKGLASSVARSFGPVAAAGGATALFMTATQLSNLQSQFLAGAGSQEQAAKNFEFVQKAAMGLGTSLQASADGYAKITIAAKNSGMTVEDSQHIFLAAAEASKAFGLNAENQAGIMKAFTQMLSKGKIGMEELNGQLGDRAPIAIAAMSKAIGKSTPELMKLMEQGKLSSAEVLKLATVIRQMAREGGALQAATTNIGAALGRLGMKAQEFVMSFMQGGGEKGIIMFLETVTVLIEDLKPIGKLLGAIFEILGQTIKETYGFLREFFTLGFAEDIDSKISKMKSYDSKINTDKYRTGFLGASPSQNNVTINVNGTRDPASTAREVDSRLQMMNRRNAVPSS